jgi:outer membrane protein assembly factor BamA
MRVQRAAVLLVAAALLQPSPVARARSYLLSKIEFRGLHRLTEAEAIALSGLGTKTPIDPATLDALGARVAATGFFRSVRARYRTTDVELTLVLDVEEADFDVPVLFDNFVGLSPKDLATAVRARVPGFDGKVPGTPAVAARIREALQDAIDAHGIRGTVVQRLGEGSSGFVFHVDGLDARICAVRFSGASSIPESLLETAMKDLVGAGYSRMKIAGLEQALLVSLYRDQGRLRASFGEPLVRPSENRGCAGGVDVEVPVVEGAVHRWGGATWSGNTAIETRELDALVAMKPGEIASGRKIEESLGAAVERYWRRGFIDVALEPREVFPEGEAAVLYQIAIREGIAYRMGTLRIEGLYEKDRLAFVREFRLAPGDVYDGVYVKGFVDDFLSDPRARRPGRSASWDARRDPAKGTVDVTLSVLPASAPASSRRTSASRW